MDVHFDLQTHLESMEDRIRLDIHQCRAELEVCANKIDLQALAQVAAEGRVSSLEEKTRWIFSGIAAGLVGLIGTGWNFFNGKP